MKKRRWLAAVLAMSLMVSQTVYAQEYVPEKVMGTEFTVNDTADMDSVEWPENSVVFKDYNLWQALTKICDADEDGYISYDELAGVTELSLSSLDITDVTGLEYAVNLNTLFLDDNYIEDITPLSDLTDLNVLWLNSNNITDIVSLSSLTRLTDLNLSSNPITDISALKSIAGLTSLNLRETEVPLSQRIEYAGYGDISVYSGYMQNIESKAARLFNTDTEITVVEGESNIQLADDSTADRVVITALKSGSGTIRFVSNGESMDIRVTVKSLPGDAVAFEDPKLSLVLLKSGIDTNNDGYISDSEMTAVEELSLSPAYVVESLSGIENAVNLKTFCMNYNFNISDFEPISALTKLEKLRINGTCVELSFLESLDNLKELILDHCNLESMESLPLMEQLENLTLLSCTNFVDLFGIENAVNLQTIYLSSLSKLADVEPLHNLTKLSEVMFSNLSALSDQDILDFLGFHDMIITGASQKLLNCMNCNFRGDSVLSLEVTEGQDCLTIIDTNDLLLKAEKNGTAKIRVIYGEAYVDINVMVEVKQKPENTVEFSDVKFEAALIEEDADTDNDGYITKEEMALLESLNLSDYEIGDISGIEYAVNLKSLLLYNYNGSFDGLAQLTSLQKLELRYCDVTDLNFLAEMKKLQYLDLSYNENLQNLETLPELSCLEELILSYCSGLSSLTGIDHAENLRNVNCNYSQSLMNIDALLNLQKLTSVGLLNAFAGETDGDQLLRLSGLGDTVIAKSDITELLLVSGALDTYDSKIINAVVNTVEAEVVEGEEYVQLDLEGGYTDGFEYHPYSLKVTGMKAGTAKICITFSGSSKDIIITVTDTENPFTDVKENTYYYDAVLWAYENGITTGKDATHFLPNNTCTRAQVVTFLWRAKGEPEPVTTENPFVDVKTTDYYYKAVLWAYENGITTGKDSTHFLPDVTVERKQFVTFLWRAENQPSASISNPFVDVPNGQYYTTAVLWAYENGVTTGKDATHFQPEYGCTRAQVAALLYRAYH